MKRALLILLAAASVASAQTFITVTADTNRVVRTNFSLVRSQISDLSGASFAISNISGLQTALDGKLATNGTLAISNITSLQSSLDGKLATNGSAAALTNFPASILQTNSSESAFPQALLRTNGSAAGLSNFPAIVLQTNSSISDFPQGLLRTNGDGSALTNLPNANLSNAIGILPLSNGGTGSTTESAARTALGLGSAATNDASAFQPASTALTNLAAGDASGLTNLPNADLGTATGVLGIANGGSAATNAEGARTNFGLVWSGLTNADAAGFRTALSLGTAATNDATAFQPASTNLDALANNNGGALTNVSVDLTAVLPAYSNNVGKVLAVASGETNVEWTALSNTVTDASLLTNFPTIILQTNSAETNFPSFLLRTNGSAAGLTSFPAIVLQTNSSESAFPLALLRTNGDGSGLTNLTAANVVGTVALASNVTETVALASNVTGTVALASNVSGTVAVANGGTGATTTSSARVNLFPSYTGNELKVLALNSNATDVIWATDGGGTANMSNVTGVLAISNGGTGASNAPAALTNLTILRKWPLGSSFDVIIGNTSQEAYGNNVVLLAEATTSVQVAIGAGSIARGGSESVAIGYQNWSEGVGIGSWVRCTNYSIAIGNGANNDFVSATGTSSIAIGAHANAIGTGSIALGRRAKIGVDAEQTVQIGQGTNSSGGTIQFRSAGVVDTNKWSALANSSTQGRYAMTNTAGISTNITFVDSNTNTNSVTISNGIITGWTQ